jgi:membrane-anchored protein YejM (alkaline phosphatase superfamily)
MASAARDRSATWLWALVACNGLAATAAHLTFADLWRFDAIGLFEAAATLAHFTTLFALFAIVPWIAIRSGARRIVPATIAIVVFGTLFLVVVINAFVYALYKFHLNTMVWYVLIQGAALQTLSFSAQMWAAVVAIAIAIYLAQAVLVWVVSRTRAVAPRLVRRYALAIALVGITTQFINAYADATAKRPLLMAVRTIPWAQPLTAKSFLGRLGFAVTESAAADLSHQTSGVFNYPLSPLQCAPSAKPNVLMLIVDSLRWDMLTDDVMPATSAWARSAVRFDHHYSTGNGTRFGIFGLMYGLPGSYWHAALAERRGPVLVDVMDDLGYQFFIYGSAPLDSPEFHRTAFARVWDRVAPPGPGDVVERDRATTRALIASIHDRDRARPFFGFLFLDAPHAYARPSDMVSPFTPRLDSINYLDLNNDFDPLPLVNLYKTSVLFDDGLIGAVLKSLDAETLENTIVLITGDHGQAFNETHDNTWGHNSQFSDYQVRVPFVVKWPGRRPETIERLTSHVDWAPTLLTDALGCTTPIDQYSTGARLFEPGETNRVLPMEQWTQRAVRTKDRVYVFLSWGGYEVRDSTYAPIDENIDVDALRSGFEQLSRFTRK